MRAGAGCPSGHGLERVSRVRKPCPLARPWAQQADAEVGVAGTGMPGGAVRQLVSTPSQEEGRSGLTRSQVFDDPGKQLFQDTMA